MNQENGKFASVFELGSLSSTETLATRIAQGLRPGDAVALEGDLGAGKTTLARFILQRLGVEEDVPSPTFTLVQEYETRYFPVFHYDLYRIQHPSELSELALEDALAEGVALIEWPERMASLPTGALRVRMDMVKEGVRRAAISGPGRWAQYFAGGQDAKTG